MNMNRERYFLTETDVFWAALPMFHMASILPFLACLDAGAAMCSMTHVDAGTALMMMERDRVTVAFPSFPTITNEIINHPNFAGTDLSALRRGIRTHRSRWRHLIQSPRRIAGRAAQHLRGTVPRHRCADHRSGHADRGSRRPAWRDVDQGLLRVRWLPQKPSQEC